MPDEPSEHPELTRLLASDNPGDAEALVPLVYEQLRAAARAMLAAESPAHTLQPTALVHEAFARLAGPRQIPWANRAHYYAAAAQAMRRVLIDHARAKGARGGRAARLDRLPDVAALAAGDPERILAVDAAVARLELEDHQAAAVVRLRFYAGLSVEQTAEALGLSPRTAARLWSLARARLHGWLVEPEDRS